MISPGGLSLQKGAVVQKKWSSTQENMTLSWWKTCPDLLWTEWDWKWQFAPWLSSTPQIVTKSTSKCNSTEEHSFPPIPNHFVEYFEDSWPKTLLFFIFLSFFAIIVGHLLIMSKNRLKPVERGGEREEISITSIREKIKTMSPFQLA